MQNHLFFICPTDFLEAPINSKFHGENYFMTSLANTIQFDVNQIEKINNLIEAKKIRRISFVLAGDNRLVVDALNSSDFYAIKGMQDFYDQIVKEKNRIELLWKSSNLTSQTISSHLHLKIQELKDQMHSDLLENIEIDAIIYSRQHNSFSQLKSKVYDTNLLCLN